MITPKHSPVQKHDDKGFHACAQLFQKFRKEFNEIEKRKKLVNEVCDKQLKIKCEGDDRNPGSFNNRVIHHDGGILSDDLVPQSVEFERWMTTTLSGVGMCWAFLSVTASVLCCSGYYLPYWIQVRPRKFKKRRVVANHKVADPSKKKGFTILTHEAARATYYNRDVGRNAPCDSLKCYFYNAHFYRMQGRLFGRADTYFGPFRRCNYPKVNSLGLIDIINECGRYSKFSDIPSIWWQCTTILVGLGCALTLLVAITATSACCFSHIIQNSTAKAAGILQLIAALLVCGGGAVYPVGWDNRELKQSCGNSSAVYKLGTCQLSWSVYLLGSAVALLLLCFALSFCSARETSEHPSFRMSPYPDGIASVT